MIWRHLSEKVSGHQFSSSGEVEALAIASRELKMYRVMSGSAPFIRTLPNPFVHVLKFRNGSAS